MTDNTMFSIVLIIISIVSLVFVLTLPEFITGAMRQLMTVFPLIFMLFALLILLKK